MMTSVILEEFMDGNTELPPLEPAEGPKTYAYFDPTGW